MMPTDRFDRQLSVLLEELGQPRTPHYFDDLLGQTARTRQRPAWSFIERWLPMVDIARQPAFARQVPWRQIAVLALIGLLVAASFAVVIGSQQRVPAPFGPARNGLVAYALDGDIYTADPVTSAATAVVSGPEMDLRPVFSLDGTRFAFERKVKGVDGPGSIYVAGADGTGLTLVTPQPIPGIDHYTFSPDGREILIVHASPIDGAALASIVKSDRSNIRALAFGNLVANDPVYRASDGREIIFVANAPGATAQGLYAVKPDGTGLRSIVAPTNQYMFGPRSSPDGKLIAYGSLGTDFETNASTPLARVYVVDAGGGGAPRLLRDVAQGDLESVVDWSNDGKRLLISGCYRSEGGISDCPSTMEVVPVSGSGAVVRIDVAAGFPGADGTSQIWAPDDTSIITTPLSPEGTPMGDAVSWDALTGRSKPVPWIGAGGTSYQRLAP